MADVFDPKKRSEVMSLVRSSHTKPEIIVRKYLFALGFRYRLHNKELPGKPDIVLAKYNTVILVNGCFWHGHHSCNTYLMPKSNADFWKTKIANNIKRDKKNMRLLKKIGWKVCVVWECELKKRNRDKTLEKLWKRIVEN